MSIAGEIAAYEAACNAVHQPIKQQLSIQIRDIRGALSLAHTLLISLSETAKEFSEVMDRGYSSSALGDAVSFRLQRAALMNLRGIYKDETGKWASEIGCCWVPE